VLPITLVELGLADAGAGVAAVVGVEGEVVAVFAGDVFAGLVVAGAVDAGVRDFEASAAATMSVMPVALVPVMPGPVVPAEPEAAVCITEWVIAEAPVPSPFLLTAASASLATLPLAWVADAAVVGDVAVPSAFLAALPLA
jgi:hypothetical protein